MSMGTIARRTRWGGGRLWRPAALGGAALALHACGGRAFQAGGDKPEGGSGSSFVQAAGSSAESAAGSSTESPAGSGGEPTDGAAGASPVGGGSPAGSAGSAGSPGTEMPVRVTDVAALSAACDPGAIHPGPSPLRRLNGLEYDNTVRDLTGLAASPATGLPFSHELAAEMTTDGFLDAGATDSPGVAAFRADQYQKAAKEIALAITRAGSSAISACDSATTGEAACAAAFIQSFGKRAFRRPLRSDEETQYQGIFTAANSASTYPERIARVVAAMLQSPNFLYRIEVGEPTGNGLAIPLTSYELATRLSYFLWGSLPDAELFAAADAGAISTVEQLTFQAKRMLADPAAHRAASEFHREWLGWTAEISKPAAAFPSWTPELSQDLLQEAVRFSDSVFWNDGRLSALLTAPYSFMNGDVARHYGLPVPPGDESAFVKVALDPTQRSGILTLGAFLAAFPASAHSNPIMRGYYIRARLLCVDVPFEPSDTGAPPTVSTSLTSRERVDSAACGTCHALIDPLGFGLSNFDAVGNWRTNDGDGPVDASGSIVGAVDPATNGPFNGPVELGQKLAFSGDVRACVAAHWFHWANGRKATLPDDACSLLTINQRFQAAGYDMRALPLAVIATDAFRYRSAALQ